MQKDARALLIAALGSVDTEPKRLADRLLDNFGTLHGLINAPEQDLLCAQNEHERWARPIIALRRLVVSGLFEEVRRTILDTNDVRLRSYLKATLGNCRHERVVAIFVDRNCAVISEEVMAEGETGFVTLPRRRIISRALALDSTGIVLAHNHPSGACEPSAADIKSTREIEKSMRGLELRVIDHLVVTTHAVVSMRDRGVI